MELLSTQQAADRLGIHVSRVKVFIREGRLPSMRVGRAHLIEASDLALVADRKVGRPPKPKEKPGESAAIEGPPIAAAEIEAGDVVETPAEEKPKKAKATKKAAATKKRSTKE